MGIFSRLADIINSNISALLDGAEDPKKLIRLIIQEMEETLIEVRSTSVRIIADKKETLRKMDRMAYEMNDWEEKAKLAISKGREDLARAAIAEKNSLAEERVILEKESESINTHLETLNKEVSQLQAKLNDAKKRQKGILLREASVSSRMKVKRKINDDNIERAFDKFESFERRLDEFEGQVESMDIARNDLASEINQLAEDEKINEELARLKKELKGE